MKQKLIPIVSGVIGILAGFLTYQHLRNEYRKIDELRESIRRTMRHIPVVVAKRDIPGGTRIDKDDLRKSEIPEISAPDRVVTPDMANMILGKKTVFDVRAKKPILWYDIEGGAPAAQGLAPMIKHRMRAVTLQISGSAAVSGMVQPNDRIDVLGTFSFPSKTVPGTMETVTLTVLQDVTVLATGQRLAKESFDSRRRSRSRSYNSVTLEVTPREAELLVFAQQTKGSLWLTLRNPSDVYYEKNLPEINFQQMEKALPELNRYRQEKIRHNPVPRR